MGYLGHCNFKANNAALNLIAFQNNTTSSLVWRCSFSTALCTGILVIVVYWTYLIYILVWATFFGHCSILQLVSGEVCGNMQMWPSWRAAIQLCYSFCHHWPRSARVLHRFTQRFERYHFIVSSTYKLKPADQIRWGLHWTSRPFSNWCKTLSLF